MQSDAIQNMLGAQHEDNSAMVQAPPDMVASGAGAGTTNVASGAQISGKQSFSDTKAGYFLGIDTDGVAKFNLGDALKYFKWNGTNLTVAGSLTAGSLDIPDTTTANSFHVDSLGNTWWGAVGIASAVGKVLNTGVATFSNMTITGGAISGWISTPTTLSTTSGGNTTTLSSSTDSFSSGPTGAPTLVITQAGTITATAGYIAGWTIGTNTLSKSAIVLDSANDQITVGTTKVILNTSGITAIAGTIGDFTLSTNALYAGNGASRFSLSTTNGLHLGADTFASAPFSVALDGTLTATNATVEGNITADTLTASSGTIGGFTIDATSLYGGVIKTGSTVGAGSNGVLMDTAGIRGYSATLGTVFSLPTDGSAPSFSSGTISNTVFEVNTSASIRTSSTVGDGTANSAGILINDTGLYACGASQTPATANVKILVDGSAVFNASVRGGQTDYATGTGYFLGLSGGDYKFSIGSSDNYMRWDGTYLTIKGSFDVGTGGVINNASYTVANLPIAPTSVGYNVPSSYE